MTEFINLLQEGRSVHEYSLEFIKVSKIFSFISLNEPFCDGGVGELMRGLPIAHAT